METTYEATLKVLEENDYSISRGKNIVDDRKTVLGEISLEGIPKITYYVLEEYVERQIRLKNIFLSRGITPIEENISQAIKIIRAKKTMIESILGEFEK